MKKSIYLFIMLFSVSYLNGFANPNTPITKGDSTKIILTNLKSLSPEVRDKQLIKVAKEWVLKRMPGFYRDIKAPIIQCFEVSEKTEEIVSIYRIKDKGRIFYSVTFLHDPKEEYMRQGFAARVYIWEDSGVVFQTTTGSGWGRFGLDELTEEEINKLPIAEYIKIPPMTIIKDTVYENGEIKYIRSRRVD